MDRQPTRAQKERIEAWREVFGRKVIKVHAPDRATGNVTCWLESSAGKWRWVLDPYGYLISATLHGTLFDTPVRLNARRATADDEVSATQRTGGSHDQ